MKVNESGQQVVDNEQTYLADPETLAAIQKNPQLLIKNISQMDASMSLKPQANTVHQNRNNSVSVKMSNSFASKGLRPSSQNNRLHHQIVN